MELSAGVAARGRRRHRRRPLHAASSRFVRAVARGCLLYPHNSAQGCGTRSQLR
jgi:hypothetical protein